MNHDIYNEATVFTNTMYTPLNHSSHPYLHGLKMLQALLPHFPISFPTTAGCSWAALSYFA